MAVRVQTCHAAPHVTPPVGGEATVAPHMRRHLPETTLGPEDVEAILDYVCEVAKRQDIYFLWRPLLRDSKDDLVAEVAVASGSDAIVTYNRRDFVGVARFGMRVIEPVELLRDIGALP